jgi:hypothetical protein
MTGEDWDDETLLDKAQPYLQHTITVGDAQALGYCVNGQRRLWRSLQDADTKHINGTSFESFIRDGVSVEWLLQTQHPYAYTLVRYVVGKLTDE